MTSICPTAGKPGRPFRAGIRFPPLRVLIIAGLVMTGRVAFCGDTFAPLIIQDGDPNGTHQGLDEFESSNGVLNVQMEALEYPYDLDGPNMPINPALGTADQQQVYPRLAFSCQDSTQVRTSYAGPLLRVHPGDRVHIVFTNDLITQRANLHFHGLAVTPHGEDSEGTFGDFVKLPYILPAAPGDTRTYDFTIPDNELPGPYWYHAHVHGVAEMQVACGLSASLYVEGSVPAYVEAIKGRFAPLAQDSNKTVSDLAKTTISEVEQTLPAMPHALLELKDFWTPGLGPINGPLEQSVNGKITYTSTTGTGSPYVIQYGSQDQVWEIINQSANLDYALQFSGSGTNGITFYVLGRDGTPRASALQTLEPETTLFIPPAGRATVIVPTSLLTGSTVNVIATTLNTGPTGDFYFQVGTGVNQRPAPWNILTLIPGASGSGGTPWPTLVGQMNELFARQTAITNRDPSTPGNINDTYVMAEPWGVVIQPTGTLPQEPTQFSFYRLEPGNGITSKGIFDGYENYEPPIAHLIPGQPQHWIIQNTSHEWHDFHLHQVHFFVDRFTLISDAAHPLTNLTPPPSNDGNPFYSSDERPPRESGKLIGEPNYSGEVDTVSIPDGMQAWLTLPLDEGSQIDGEFVMHCHILEHEDGGMMANVVAGPYAPSDEYGESKVPHLEPAEVAAVDLKAPAPLKDSSGGDITSDVFRKNEFSLVTFGYTTCQGACPLTVAKCVNALSKLAPADAARISPFWVSLDVERDNPAKLRAYARQHNLSPAWEVVLDTKLAAARAFGARRTITHKPDGSLFLTHSTAIYLIDRSMKIRATFYDDDPPEKIAARIQKELQLGQGAVGGLVKG
jgi:FtsP/CotA-like multicopper oxidase with cupredoxin domain/cytochrome oxidase Cu insertion factor (SCO1/SenC/PrrC family)